MKKTAQKISEKEGGGRSSKKPSKESMWVIKFVGFVLSFFFLSCNTSLLVLKLGITTF